MRGLRLALVIVVFPGLSFDFGFTWGLNLSFRLGFHLRLDCGKVPFEIHEMHAKPDGFELTFTYPVDPKSAGDVKSYTMKTFTYIYQSSYGSPEVDETKPTIDRVEVAADAKSVRLHVSKLMEGHIHELHAPGIRSAEGLPLLHKEAYYTLNYIPAK